MGTSNAGKVTGLLWRCNDNNPHAVCVYFSLLLNIYIYLFTYLFVCLFVYYLLIHLFAHFIQKKMYLLASFLLFPFHSSLGLCHASITDITQH